MYRKIITSTKVPIHGNLGVDDKAEDAIRLFWLRRNYKAGRLKFVFQQYGIDVAGLKEIFINRSLFKASQITVSLFWGSAEPIRLVASPKKQETKTLCGNNMEEQQQFSENNSRHSSRTQTLTTQASGACPSVS